MAQKYFACLCGTTYNDIRYGAKMTTVFQTPYYAFNLLFMVTILFMKFNYYEFTTSVNKGYYANTNSTNLLRFRDFEPRNMVKTEAETDMAASDRKSRGFQFHADDRDVSIELEFIVPFVRIPIERSMDMTKRAFRNLFNLNQHSILTTGAVVAVGGIFAILLKFLFTPFAGHYGSYRKTSRNSEEYGPYARRRHQFEDDNSTTPSANNIISLLDNKLNEHNIDLSICIQKIICDYVQKGSVDVNSDTAGSVQKIIDGVLSLPSVRNVLSGTAVKHAVDTARNGDDCNMTYRSCNWNPSAAYKTIGILTKVIKYLNIT